MGASLGRRQRCEQRLEQPADRDGLGSVLHARRWQGRGPGPGELGVLEEHLRQVWLQWVSEREIGSGRWAGASRAAGRAPGAERGFEPMTRRSKNENYLQFLHTGERVFGQVALFVFVFIIT